ncbi:MAG: glycosyltransferase family 2 protein [Planctomycetia bacterium]|nr:glycosyltransferase family 2 protein [Planctomycetia bacterium]
MSIVNWLLIGYAGLGGLYWLWMAVGMWRVTRRVPVLVREPLVEPPRWPRLSIIIPACNEGDTLEGAIATVRRLDYPDLEIVLIDDRSEDDTGRIVDRIAAEDARVRPIHVTELPDGWLGKVHALARGVEAAGGEWVLFTDADVHMAPTTLRRAVAHAERHALDQLAVAPEMWPNGWLLDAMISLFLRVFCVGMRVWAVGDPRSRAFIGVGAFNLVRRSALERTPGFAWLRMEVGDDVGLGLMLKRSGARCCLAGGKGLVGLDWYRSLAEVARGTEKAYASVAVCHFPRLVAICILAMLAEYAPWVAILCWGVPGMTFAAAAMLALGLASVVRLHQWAERPILSGLLTPVVLPLAVLLLLRAGVLGLARGGIVWRGTLYPSRALIEGRRLRMFWTKDAWQRPL